MKNKKTKGNLTNNQTAPILQRSQYCLYLLDLLQSEDKLLPAALPIYDRLSGEVTVYFRTLRAKCVITVL